MVRYQTMSVTDKPPLDSKPTIGLVLLTVLWAYAAFVDGPLLVRLALWGARDKALIIDCNKDGGQLCLARTATGKEALLRNSLLASYKVGTTIDVRMESGDGKTMRAEAQIARSAAMRLLAAFVLAGLWIRMWAKSKTTESRVDG